MNNLTIFNTLGEYNEFKQKEMPYTNVSYVGENDTVYYFKEDIETAPFTVKIVDLDPNYNECELWCQGLNGEAKFRIGDTDWQQHDGTELIKGLHNNDEIQIIAKHGSNLGDMAVWINEGWDTELIGKVELSGNIMSYINGEDYLQDPEVHQAFNWAEWRYKQTFKDISNLWLPYRLFADNTFNGLFNGCTALENIPTVKANYVPANGLYGMYGGCTSLTEATVDVQLVNDQAWGTAFEIFADCTSLETLYISKDTNLCPQQYIHGQGICARCTSLNAVYNYSPNWVDLATDLTDPTLISQTGTLYYVDYGNNMNYDPNEMVPSGWTKTAIQLPQ